MQARSIELPDIIARSFLLMRHSAQPQNMFGTFPHKNLENVHCHPTGLGPPRVFLVNLDNPLRSVQLAEGPR